ncbi:cytosine permease [Streptomyces mirabilis]|uniref:cytosine permease n=1 Tax=Streptomyces mirabilis TaxID=68239 RepID=UPI003443941A
MESQHVRYAKGRVGCAQRGKRGGAPGMTLSRAVFGRRGNLLPGSLIWIARWGWETINAVTGSYALLTVLNVLFGIRSNTFLIVATLPAFVVATFSISGLGISAVRTCSTWATWLFGGFSVLVLGHLVADTDWGMVFGQPAGPTPLMITGVGLIAAGGISWAPSAPDLTRYLPRGLVGGDRAQFGGRRRHRRTPPDPDGRGIGGLDAGPGLGRRDPVSFVGTILPLWIAVPYLLIALVGMPLINAMSMYSAGFTAQTLGIKVSRHRAVAVNAVISLVLGGVLMLVATSFMGSFIAFLSLLAVAFSARVGVFGADMLRREAYDAEALLDTTRTSAHWYRGGFSPAAVAAWALGLGSGLLFSTSDWFTGPLASNNPVREYGLGRVATVAVSFLPYAVLPKPAVAPVAQPAKGSATMAV